MSMTRRFLVLFLIFIGLPSGLIAIYYINPSDIQSVLQENISDVRDSLNLPQPESSSLQTPQTVKPEESLKPRKKKAEPEVKVVAAPKKEVLQTKQKIKELEQESIERAKLNLSLPDDWEAYEWQKPTYYSSYPNFFVSKKHNSRFGVSGALHLDEREEAEERPIEKSILGGEVEIQWKLP